MTDNNRDNLIDLVPMSPVAQDNDDNTVMIELLGGTEHGLSAYETLVECPRKHYLASTVRAQSGPQLFGGQSEVGTWMHAFLELFYRGSPVDPAQVMFSVDGMPIPYDAECRLKAIQTMRVYAERYSAFEFGRPLAIERAFSNVTLTSGRDPVAEATGLPVYTWRPDMIVTVTAEIADGIRANRGPSNDSVGCLIRPGTYMVDHKTLSANRDDSIARYEHSLQFMLYQVAHNALVDHGVIDLPRVDGVILNFIVTTKTPQFFTRLVPSPGLVELAIVNAFAAQVKLRLGDIQRQRAVFEPKTALQIQACYQCVPNACYNGFQRCSFLGTHCQRF